MNVHKFVLHLWLQNHKTGSNALMSKASYILLSSN